MKHKKTLSACLIVRDEEKLIRDCLLSISGVVDEIVIVDTGSADKTPDICREFTDKIYLRPWTGSFADARNYSMEKASSDWILLLDADERLVPEDGEKLLEFIQTTTLDGAHFKVYNYIGSGEEGAYTVHTALRLVRNNGAYLFVGDIHEQIAGARGGKIADRFTILDVRLKHLGYLDDVVREKEKRKRNIPMILKQLENDPENAFTLFNLGNEYMALGELDRALETYLQSARNMRIQEAYAPHLFYRMAVCQHNMRLWQESIQTLETGLATYPQCTDMEYYKGLVYLDWKRYTLAIQSFEKAMEMGAPPDSLRFTDYCESIKPLYALGRLYLDLHDCANAIKYFNRVVGLDGSPYFVLYDVGEALNRKYQDKEVVEQEMCKYFGSLEHLPNLIVMTDILIAQRLYRPAGRYLQRMQAMEGYEDEQTLLMAKLHYYAGEYAQAYPLFCRIVQKRPTGMLISGGACQSARYAFAAALLTGKVQDAREALRLVYTVCGRLTGKVYELACDILEGRERDALPGDADMPQMLRSFGELLGLILGAGAFELFEKLLYTYNYLDTDQVLLSLAGVYWANGYYDLCIKSLHRSACELQAMNVSGAELLLKAYLER